MESPDEVQADANRYVTITSRYYFRDLCTAIRMYDELNCLLEAIELCLDILTLN